MPNLCLVVPCFNEARRLPAEAFLAFVAEHADVTVCFVDDGSSDGTGALLARLSGHDSGRVLALRLDQNQGKAEAVRRGVRHVAAMQCFELIGYWDADLASPLPEVWPLVDALARHPDCQLVLGSRLKRLGAQIERRATRHLLGRAFATLASLTIALPVYDSQCGAKLFRASSAGILFDEPFVTSWLFDLELIVRLRNHLGDAAVLNAVAEVPLTHWRDVAGSKLGAVQMATAAAGLLRIRRHYHRR